MPDLSEISIDLEKVVKADKFRCLAGFVDTADELERRIKNVRAASSVNSYISQYIGGILVLEFNYAQNCVALKSDERNIKTEQYFSAPCDHDVTSGSTGATAGSDKVTVSNIISKQPDDPNLTTKGTVIVLIPNPLESSAKSRLNYLGLVKRILHFKEYVEGTTDFLFVPRFSRKEYDTLAQVKQYDKPIIQ